LQQDTETDVVYAEDRAAFIEILAFAEYVSVNWRITVNCRVLQNLAGKNFKRGRLNDYRSNIRYVYTHSKCKYEIA
jgi:hypothetical protein